MHRRIAKRRMERQKKLSSGGTQIKLTNAAELAKEKVI